MCKIIKTMPCPKCRRLAPGTDMEVAGTPCTIYKCKCGQIFPEVLIRTAERDRPANGNLERLK